MSAGSNETAADVWGRFVRTPSLGAHPAWIAGMFDGALPLEAAGRLAAHPRFASRVSSLMAARHGFGDIDAPAEPADQAIALSDSQTLGTIIRRAGAVCWADRSRARSAPRRSRR
ncbi:hypothetical protein [Chenggangzhangella methanolivorans]|uniref:Uncharacterized protein n=1 Tax=Chenggangzhangella methanolivorans TaxID=1437009 RepID=A0A9E6R5A5_9HYPH|nr:hypothetical protein [Chenggangzhangella methanolivorans]QZN98465.1 hypothetical protein K6K41_15475 [Chenggangzhangella methanolivorans]